MTAVAIGGYFGWEHDAGVGLEWLRRASRYQSARCAIVALLRAVRPRRIWAPNYICGAVNDALLASGTHVKRYPLSSTWGVSSDIDMESGDWMFCVDYFGISRFEVEAALDRFGSQCVLVDASQSLFYRPRAEESVIYSPRKFAGVPDGGLLIAGVDLPLPREADEGDSRGRCAHLLSRAEGRVEEGYRQFLSAEESLNNCEPVAMSALTAKAIDKLNAQGISRQRVANYELLASQLSLHGMNVPSLPHEAVPLCCPVSHLNASRMRKELAARGVYTPAYWPDAVVPADDPYGLMLRDATLFLPCDQRYGAPEMTQVVSSLLQIKDPP